MFAPTDSVSVAPPFPSFATAPPPSYRLSVTKVGVAIDMSPVTWTWTHKIPTPQIYAVEPTQMNCSPSLRDSEHHYLPPHRT